MIVELMKYPVQKISKSRDFILDAFARTISTAKVCPFLEKKMRSLSCANDGSCLEKSTVGLVKAYAFQLLNDKSGLKGRNDLIEAGRMYMSVVKCLTLKQPLASVGCLG